MSRGIRGARGAGGARRWSAAGAVLAIALAACGGGTTEPAGGEPRESTDVPSGAVGVGATSFTDALGATAFYSGIGTRDRRVIRDAAGWQELWAQATSIVLPPPPAPAIDFARDEVIVAAMGTRPTGGYAIVIEAVYEADGKRWVVVRETSPGPTCVVTMALSAPLAAVRVARTSLPTLFVERAAVAQCG